MSRYDRGRLPDALNDDIFRYYLASMSVIPWEGVYVYCGLDGRYDTPETREKIQQTFIESFASVPHQSLEFNRLLTLGEWQAALRPALTRHPDSLIYYSGNHDHIFIDYDLECLNACVGFAQKHRSQNPFISIPYSHWLFEISHRSQILLNSHHYIVGTSQRRDSIQILTPELMHKWFFEDSQKIPQDTRVRRTEDLGWLGAETFLRVAPNRELVRHFDGDSHISVACADYAPLNIPTGFFERNIRIATYPVGGRDYAALEREGYTVFDPSCRDLAAAKAGGAYARQTAQDIPLFWRSRISSIDAPPNEDAAALLRQRDAAMHDVVRIRYNVDLPTAKTMFPAAFRTPLQDWDGLARTVPSKATDRTSRSFELRRELARSYKVSRADDAEVSIVLLDRLPAPALSDLFVEDLVQLKQTYKVEFVYVCMLEDSLPRWYTPFTMSSTLVRVQHHDLVDEVLHYQYDFMPDKLQALKSALSRCHAPLAVAIEMTHGATRLRFRPFVERAIALRKGLPSGSLDALASPTSIAAGPSVVCDPQLFSSMAFPREQVFDVLTAHDDYVALDTWPLAKTLSAVFKAHGLPVHVAEPANSVVFHGQYLGPKLLPINGNS
ncbi:MAG: hypothetical protein ABTQ34_05180 [Bdellovibrionales bacterium]